MSSKLKYKLNNKKAFIDEAVPFIIFIFVFAIVIFFFQIIKNDKTSALLEEIQKQKAVSAGHDALMGYLMMLDSQGSRKIDFVAKSINEKRYDDLKQDISTYLNKRIGHLYWYLDSKWMSGKQIFTPVTNIGQSVPEAQYITQFWKSSFIVIPINGAQPDYAYIELSVSSK